MKLKFYLIALAALVSSSFAKADPHNVRGILGFTQSAFNIGVDYENRFDSMLGVGGYFLLSSEKEDAGKGQVISIGGMLPVHLTASSPVIDVYIAPGVGISVVDVPAGDDETILGPTMKIGVLYALNPQIKIGIDQLYVANWFSDKVSADGTYTNFAMNFSF